jgi:hypothetical protein
MTTRLCGGVIGSRRVLSGSTIAMQKTLSTHSFAGRPSMMTRLSSSQIGLQFHELLFGLERLDTLAGRSF